MTHDRDIREPLFAFLEEKYGKVRFIEEKNMGRSRADIVMVTEGALIGLEIKSDADTYARLARQVRDYDRYFDRNICVAGVSHMGHIEEHLPHHWGIIAAEALPDGRLDFYQARKAQENPKRSLQRKLSLLWRRELNHMLGRNGMPRYAGESKHFVAMKLLSKIPEAALDIQIADELFERDYTTISDEIEAYRAARGDRERKRRVRAIRRK